jgi:trigger factor
LAEKIKAEIEDVDNIRKKLTVTVPVESVSREFDKAYRETRKKAVVSGFRKGHVPLKMIKQLYGEDLKADVAQRIISRSYQEALEETGLEPVSSPSIMEYDLDESKPLTYTAELEVRPEIQLPEYKGLKLTKKVEKVTEQDVTKVLEDLRGKVAQMESVTEERPLKEGDVAIMDFNGYRQGEPIEGGKGVDYPLEIGSGTFIDGFEEAMIGAKAGEERKFVLTFPKDYQQPELAGEEVQFIVTLKSIKEKILPEVDDEFARDVGEYKDLEELKKGIRENVANVRDREAMLLVKKDMLDQLIQKSSFDLPPSMLEREKGSAVRDYGRRLAMQGVSEEEIQKQIEGAMGEIEKIAANNIKSSMILDEIARVEEIKLEKEDLDKAVKEMSERQKRPAGEVRKDLIKSGAMEGFAQVTLEQKTLDFLIEKADIGEGKTAAKKEGK